MHTINCHTGEVLRHKDDEQAALFSFYTPATLHAKEPRDINVGLLARNVMWLYSKVTGKELPPDTGRVKAAELLFTAVKKHSTVAPTISENTMPAIKSRSTRRVARQSTRNARRSTGERRHNSPLAGKKLIKQQRENPRREGTEGFKSWNKYQSGVTYEKAIESGARPQDIRWDLDKGYLKAK